MIISKFHYNVSSFLSKLTQNKLFNSEFSISKDPYLCVDKVVIDQKVANILIGCPEFRIIFKIYYNDELGKKVMDRGEKYTSGMVDDSFKEACNVLGGKVKNLFLNHEYNLGISIPVKTRGMDELFFDIREDDQYSEQFFWELKKNDITVVMAAFIEIINLEVVESIDFKKIENDSEDEEDVEFF